MSSPGPEPGEDLGGTWLAMFVDEPGRNRQVDAAPGEHFPPAELDGCRLLAANETSRVARYRRPIERDAVETGASSAVSGLSGSRREGSESESGHDDSGELSASMAAHEATVERVMWAIAAEEGYFPGELSDSGKELYDRMARAALRALRVEQP